MKHVYSQKGGLNSAAFFITKHLTIAKRRTFEFLLNIHAKTNY